MRWRLALVAALCIPVGFVAGRTTRNPFTTQSPAASNFDAARHAQGVDRWRDIWRLGDVRPSFVMLGDSLTVTPQWHELTGCGSIANRGMYSDTAASVLRRIDDVIEMKPRGVFLLIGVNDVRHGRPPEEVAATTRAIVTRLLEAGIAVYRSPILPVALGDRGQPKETNDRIARANEAVEVALAGLAVTPIDLRPMVTGADGQLRRELTHDGLHFNATGYALWRDAILPTVRRHCVVASGARL